MRAVSLAAMAALLLLSGCAATAPVGHAELQLIGSWSGAPDGDGNGVVGMAVAEAATDGSTFRGELTYSIEGQQSTEPVRAAMTPNGHLVAEIGDGSSVEVHIVDPQTLDYCFIRYGTGFVYSCGRLVRGS